MTKKNLTGGRLLARNSILNLIGLGVPAVVALVVIPRLITGMGIERFGILSLAWMLIGYFGLFDFGLGESVTQMVSEKIGAGEDHSVPGIVWTGLILMFAFGMLGGLILGALSPWLVQRVLAVPDALKSETLAAFYLVSLAVPVVVVTAGMQGVLASFQQFRLISAVRAGLGVFTFVGPLLALGFSKSLAVTVGTLIIGRLAACAIYFLICSHAVAAFWSGFPGKHTDTARLLVFGSWMTVSNIVSPLMAYMDRFLIGSLLSLGSVAYYTTPCDIAGRMTLIPAALADVLFPAFSTSFRTDLPRAKLLYLRGIKYIFVAMLPVSVLVVAFAREGLTAWLGADFANHSTLVLQLMTAGFFFNSLARVPFVLVQGARRPDLTAKFHMAEMAFYLPVVWWAIKWRGIQGAALVWTGRICVDALILFFIAHRLLKIELSAAARMAALAILSFGVFLGAAVLADEAVKLLLVVGGVLVFWLLWWRQLGADERKGLAGVLIGA